MYCHIYICIHTHKYTVYIFCLIVVYSVYVCALYVRHVYMLLLLLGRRGAQRGPVYASWVKLVSPSELNLQTW